MRAVIRSIGAYVPAKRVSNDELAESIDTSGEWIRSRTGIRYRHIAGKHESSSDLAVKAARAALDRADMKPEELDMIICPTSTPDYPGFPSTACIVQGKIGADAAGAFDLGAACSGFVYALEIGRCMILNRKAKNILIVAAEVMSRFIDWKDRNTCILFGDGAGAVILSADNGAGESGILFSFLRAEGEGAEYLKIPCGGTKHPYNKENIINGKNSIYLQMAGQKVYNFATRAFTSVIMHILRENNITINEIDYVVPHQANIRIIETASRRLELPIEKFYINIQEYANTIAATIPIALNEMNEKKLLKEGDLLLTIGFGAGLTYGGNLIRW